LIILSIIETEFLFFHAETVAGSSPKYLETWTYLLNFLAVIMRFKIFSTSVDLSVDTSTPVEYFVYIKQHLSTGVQQQSTQSQDKMNEICRKIWDRDLTVAKWSALNGFNPRYVQAVFSGKRGAWGAGTAKKIFKALVDQGLMSKEEAASRVKP
jgi:hypothetical protein